LPGIALAATDEADGSDQSDIMVGGQRGSPRESLARARSFTTAEKLAQGEKGGR
jgi:hypothetical protein